MSAIDWDSKPEPWRSIGRLWREQCAGSNGWRSDADVPHSANPMEAKAIRAAQIKHRRLALGISGIMLDREAETYFGATSELERTGAPNGKPYHKIIAALDRLESVRNLAVNVK